MIENEMDNVQESVISSNFNTISSFRTFSTLRLSNITKDLLQLYIPIDVLERYLIYEQNYLFSNDLDDNEIINFCEDGWFGVFCEYSFDNGDFVNGRLLFYEIIQRRFQLKRSENLHPFDVLTETNWNVPCYMSLKNECQRPIGLCLDWREICDGMFSFLI
ncbi:unnamed protein product [Rotaria sp. Silwood1]|nr:unnamed protein product [Rotaria sp. Silwood1]CAF1614648.1 unnamed protein product [Rotaria sp. Silwood1]CAF3734078.1 unnamed protein product [Rotaria sp. Silwood1]CAF3759286.1 unnamed protein product [Rotaria sp. Silwood1]CAF4885952.1 unnamed protein product [Rotaria sp. Silwood1]